MRPFNKRAAAVAFGVALSTPAYAQIDPMQFMKLYPPNVVVGVDLSARMQRDTPTDPANPRTTSAYYDPVLYPRDLTQAYQTTSLGVSALNTNAYFRRRYDALDYASNGSDKFSSSGIAITGDIDTTGYVNFEAPTRLSIARAALYQAVVENARTARFSLVKMRQKTPASATLMNSGPTAVSPGQQSPTDITGSTNGRWNISRNTVDSSTANGKVSQASKSTVATVHADTDQYTTLLNLLAVDERNAWQDTTRAAPNTLPAPLLAAGNDDANTQDTPVYNLLLDSQLEAQRLIDLSSGNNATDPTCRNTIVILIVGGGEGNTTTGATNASLATLAGGAGFLSYSSHRVPVYVIALGPPSADSASLRAIATASGGQYYEVNRTAIQKAFSASSCITRPTPANPSNTCVFSTGINGTVVVPDVVAAINSAVAHAYANATDFNTFNSASFPKATYPLGPISEFQTVAPITGTVNLSGGHDINGAQFPTSETDPVDKSGNVIPERSNVLLTSGFITPSVNGYAGVIRAFRVYKAVADTSQLSNNKFVADGTRLWNACVPGSTPTLDHPNGCSTVTGVALTDSNLRNLYTVTPNGTMIPFTTSNTATLAPLMNLNATDASTVIQAVRNLPLGPIMSSTPAIMNPPSLDPPPDDTYPAFSAANAGRRTIIWVGTNWGILEGIDARLGVEVWGFIPLNALPKLKTLVDGQPTGNFDYFVDSSPKVADVRYKDTCSPASACWHSHLVIGEGTGGTFYQSFDVTMSDMASAVTADSDDINAVLTYFSTPRITLNWAFPSYSDFDPTVNAVQHCDPSPTNNTGCDSHRFGDVSASATAVEKSVGQTWSDPAIGEVGDNTGPYVVLVGSGYLPYAAQQQANRGGTVAGTSFYILDAKTGTVYDSKNVGSDNLGETANNCRSNSTGCKQMKNAIQADPVSTGPAGSRYVTAAYVGDLDGRLWRFDIILDSSNNNNPKINATTNLFTTNTTNHDEPIFSSMATVNVSGTQQYIFFGTGSDLLGASDGNTKYHLFGVLDNGASGTAKFTYALTKTAGNGNNAAVTADERVTAFPAVAGDIVFFTTTTFNAGSLLYGATTACSSPTANLYAFTFIGGPAYANTGQSAITNSTVPKVASVAGARATAPFIIDQHLAFGAGGQLQMFGDPAAYNNGVGNAGVRVLSWREVR